MKITVCDVCKSEGKMVETTTGLTVKGKTWLKIDLCKQHATEVRAQFPRINVEYAMFVMKAKGTPIGRDTAESFLKMSGV